MKTLTLSALLILALTGCAKVNDTGMRLLASSSPALAVVDDTLLSGKVTVYIDRSGTVNLESGPLSGLKCMGTLRYTATRSGVVNLQCSNGTNALMNFNAIGETSGYGGGKTAKGLATFAFGLEPADAMAYLKLPAGKRVVETPEGPALAPL
jgi:hypothetical protein